MGCYNVFPVMANATQLLTIAVNKGQLVYIKSILVSTSAYLLRLSLHFRPSSLLSPSLVAVPPLLLVFVPVCLLPARAGSARPATGMPAVPAPYVVSTPSTICGYLS